MKLYIVFIYCSVKSNNSEIIGVFDTEEKAIEACRTPLHGYGEIELNKDLGDELTEWPNFIYPMGSDK